MTKRSFITQAELKRMADVATSEGVTIEVEREGTIVRVMPFRPEHKSSTRAPKKPGEFKTIAEWQEWRERQTDRVPKS